MFGSVGIPTILERGGCGVFMCCPYEMCFGVSLGPLHLIQLFLEVVNHVKQLPNDYLCNLVCLQEVSKAGVHIGPIESLEQSPQLL